jgi:hypothetical protein
MSGPRTKNPHHRRPYVDPPPLVRLQTVQQTEERHPALRGRLRSWIHKGDAGIPEYIGLRRAIVRVGRSLFINEIALDEWLAQRSAMPPARPRTKHQVTPFAASERESSRGP